MKSLNRGVRSDKTTRTVVAHGRALPAASPTSEGEELYPSRLQESSSDEPDTRNNLKSSPVQREYTRVQKLVVWALIIATMVMSVIDVFILKAKAHGTLLN
jgi:hypothetical protein